MHGRSGVPHPFRSSRIAGLRLPRRHRGLVFFASLAGYILMAFFVPYAAFWYPGAIVLAVGSLVLLRRRAINRAQSAIPQLKDRSTTEIGEAWMLTSLLLWNGPSRSDRLHLCRVRDAYLEEFSLRDPEGFQQWVADALAGRDCRPDTYIRRQTREDGDLLQWRRILRHHLSWTSAHRRSRDGV